MKTEDVERIDWGKIFNSVEDAIFVADMDNTIVKANTAFAKLLGMKVDDIIGKKCYELVHKLHIAWPGCPFEKSKKDKKMHIEEVEDPAVGKPLLVTTSPIFDSTGRMLGVAHISKDITNIKKSEAVLKQKIEELERFQKVTVGRELKMKELKARIEELEARLDGLERPSGAG